MTEEQMLKEEANKILQQFALGDISEAQMMNRLMFTHRRYQYRMDCGALCGACRVESGQPAAERVDETGMYFHKTILAVMSVNLVCPAGPLHSQWEKSAAAQETLLKEMTW